MHLSAWAIKILNKGDKGSGRIRTSIPHCLGNYRLIRGVFKPLSCKEIYIPATFNYAGLENTGDQTVISRQRLMHVRKFTKGVISLISLSKQRPVDVIYIFLKKGVHLLTHMLHKNNFKRRNNIRLNMKTIRFLKIVCAIDWLYLFKGLSNVCWFYKPEIYLKNILG